MLVGALGLAACTGGGGGGPAAAPDPCRVVTRGEFAAHVNLPPAERSAPVATFRPVGVPPPVNVVGMDFCTFLTTGAHQGLVRVGLSRSSRQFAREAFDKWRKGDADAKALQPIEGLGTEALWQPGDNATLVVLGDDAIVAVSVTEPSDHRLERSRRLAVLALGRDLKPVGKGAGGQPELPTTTEVAP